MTGFDHVFFVCNGHNSHLYFHQNQKCQTHFQLEKKQVLYKLKAITISYQTLLQNPTCLPQPNFSPHRLPAPFPCHGLAGLHVMLSLLKSCFYLFLSIFKLENGLHNFITFHCSCFLFIIFN